MTIPYLISNNNEKQTVVQLKKSYSALSNAFILAQAQYGSVKNWDLSDNYDSGILDPDSLKLFNYISPFLNVIKKCNPEEECFPPKTYSGLNGETLFYDTDVIYKALLLDGTIIRVYKTSPNCEAKYGTSEALSNVCGVIETDINSSKGPNKWGYDLFRFYISQKGIVPMGTAEETNNSIEKRCKNKFSRGDGCTAWVLLKENMDYLKKNISWND